MPGLADILKGASSKLPSATKPAVALEVGADEAAPDSSGSAKGFARIAAQALADQDIDAAADAFESLARAVK